MRFLSRCGIRSRHARRISRPTLLLLVLLLAPAVLAAHVVLASSSPGSNELLDEAPAELRLVFSGRIEERYTGVTLHAPNGDEVPLGPVLFAPGSDREFTAAVPPVTLPGTWTVRWRTAGIDGHVLQGSYSFVLVADTAAVGPDVAVDVPLDEAAGADEHDHGGMTSGSPSHAAARWLHFTALVLLLGAVCFRSLVLQSIAAEPATSATLRLRLWRLVAVAALLLVAAALLRLWLQSVALHGAERAWSSDLLAIMLTETGWGRAWLLQALLLVLLAAALAWARPGRDTGAFRLAAGAAFGLAAIPALGGHAAGSVVMVINDTAHVIAASAWLGTLAALVIVAIPTLLRAEDGAGSAAEAVRAFSPLAMGAAGVVVFTGVINGWMHVEAPAQLLESPWGRALLVKLVGAMLLFATGFYHWRFVRPFLGARTMRGFRITAAAELAIAALVLAATAVLTGLARP